MNKKSIIIFLMLGLVLQGGASLAAQTIGSILGNVNVDNAINIIDALCTAQYAAGLKITSFNGQLADVDGNGAINVIDAMLIAQYVTGLLTQFPGQPNGHAIDPQYKVIMVPVIDETIYKAGVR